MFYLVFTATQLNFTMLGVDPNKCHKLHVCSHEIIFEVFQPMRSQ